MLESKPLHSKLLLDKTIILMPELDHLGVCFWVLFFLFSNHLWFSPMQPLPYQWYHSKKFSNIYRLLCQLIRLSEVSWLLFEWGLANSFWLLVTLLPSTYNFLLGTRPGKTDPKPETWTDWPESMPELIPKMGWTDLDPVSYTHLTLPTKRIV